MAESYHNIENRISEALDPVYDDQNLNIAKLAREFDISKQ
jgi:hypothetical protein